MTRSDTVRPEGRTVQCGTYEDLLTTSVPPLGRRRERVQAVAARAAELGSSLPTADRDDPAAIQSEEDRERQIRAAPAHCS